MQIVAKPTTEYPDDWFNNDGTVTYNLTSEWNPNTGERRDAAAVENIRRINRLMEDTTGKATNVRVVTNRNRLGEGYWDCGWFRVVSTFDTYTRCALFVKTLLESSKYEQRRALRMGERNGFMSKPRHLPTISRRRPVVSFKKTLHHDRLEFT